MRPKKVVLCVYKNEDELSVLSYMLHINCYRVLTASTAEEAIKIFATTQVDLVLADADSGGFKIVDRLKQLASYIPMIVMGDPQTMSGHIYSADALLAKKTCSPQELLERIKVMCYRKRGPRPGVIRAIPMAQKLQTA